MFARFVPASDASMLEGHNEAYYGGCPGGFVLPLYHYDLGTGSGGSSRTWGSGGYYLH
eukprot:CAMPEP_0175827402 /NCGR_PEP_ID=MMETSP0107_2-20121207/12266_1 /TAXON_ID=195067 ORGANISM="Goniomonas pacifica, Strain CCMP1869" /NCGR_SAMPLE_ID=MMETSP0107_2 /ASSEMBLY_ACC=CAM_ASM_000203 /LENGTH=57 /DNA_ID=CAMNT_0017140079 /DNA_START=23 /DNA_END=196 /DNA_ORIENTATION=-